MRSAGVRAEYSNRMGAAPLAARIMDISGTMPLPPAMSCSGAGEAGSQVNQPPIGPRSSTWSPGAMTSVRYGETSPSARRCTVSSRRPAPGADAIE
jgi:hypothetical protein